MIYKKQRTNILNLYRSTFMSNILPFKLNNLYDHYNIFELCIYEYDIIIQRLNSLAIIMGLYELNVFVVLIKVI